MNRTQPSPTSGAGWRSGRLTAATVKRLPTSDRGGADLAATGVPGTGATTGVVELGEGGQVVGEAETVVHAQRLERGADVRPQRVGRGLVVVGEPGFEAGVGDAGDRF